VEKSSTGLNNTAVVVGPEGYIGKYRKQHLNTFDETLGFGGVKASRTYDQVATNLADMLECRWF